MKLSDLKLPEGAPPLPALHPFEVLLRTTRQPYWQHRSFAAYSHARDYAQTVMHTHSVIVIELPDTVIWCSFWLDVDREGCGEGTSNG